MNGSERGGWARAIAPVALAVATIAVSGEASAGSVTVTMPTITRPMKDGGVTLQRPDSATYYISYQDCLDNVELDFPVAVSSQAGFQVWASYNTDCKSGTNRTMAGTGCVQLAASFPTGTGKVTVKAQDLLQKVFNIGSDCVDPSTATAPRPLNIYFMLSPDNGDVTGTDVFTWDKTQVDLLGPTAPTGISLGIGDGELILNLPTNTDADTLGYYIYCYDGSPSDAGTTSSSSSTSASSSSSSSSTSASSGAPDGGGGAGGAGGAGGMGGAGGAASSSSSSASSSGAGAGGGGGAGGGSSSGGATACDSNAAIPGIDPSHPDVDSPYICGKQIPASATSPSIPDLVNGTQYIVGIAAYDEVNNIGPISSLQCGTPQKTDTFFSQYCADGGTACDGGCSSCAVGGPADLTWPGLGAGALAAVGLAARRARRRRAERLHAREEG